MLILASSSPRRAQLLTELGVKFRIETRNIQELPTEAASWLTAEEFAWHNALHKTRAVAREFPRLRTLGADTIVTLGHTIYGKPKDLDDAARMLLQLSGRTHRVITAVALACGSHDLRGEIMESAVTFKRLKKADVLTYLELVNVLDKAGAYAAQEHSELIIERIEGSFSNVMGLPLEAVARLLKK